MYCIIEYSTRGAFTYVMRELWLGTTSGPNTHGLGGIRTPGLDLAKVAFYH